MFSSSHAPRRNDLDWLRILAFGILIFYHIGMFYVSWDWHVKSVHAGPEAEWLMMLVNPWRLSLLFLISGVALRFALDKTGGGRLARERVVRLGLPVIFGMAVVVAPQSWLQLLESGEISEGFFGFYPEYLDFGSAFSITTPTWNHLWYVVYLLVYTLVLALVGPVISAWASGPGERVFETVFGGRWGVPALLLVPALPHCLYRVLLDPHFPTTHALANDWANHAHSFTILMTGFLFAKSPAFWRAVARAWPWALGLTIGLGAGLSVVWANWEVWMAEDGALIDYVWPARLARIWYAWLMIAAILGMGQRWLNRPGRALTYMTEAIFPWYILHQTLTVMAGFWLTRQGLNVWVEFAGVTLATIGGCLLLHEFVIRRLGWLRPLFGLKPRRGSRMRLEQPSRA
ncbi:MAG: acyltransferase family protein [Hyphomonadaceae bacterium]|nr:acyltransferase family protein [Hyphomonadaceae bacterium]